MPDTPGTPQPPRWDSEIRDRLDGLRLAPTRAREIVDELSQHLDDHWRELVDGGASPEEATRLTRTELNDRQALARRMATLRQAHVTATAPPGSPVGHPLSDLWHDLRYAFRMLRKEPGFAAAAVFTLALGIGANGAIFALVDGTLLRPLPFPAPDRLVAVWEQTPQAPAARVSPLNMLDWNARSRSVETIAGYVPNIGGMVLGGGDGPAETVSRQWVTYGIFDALGVSPVAGRTFRREDDERRLNSVVLSESYWRAQFGGDAAVVGTTMTLDGEPYTVLGVVGDEAKIIGRASLWALVPFTGAGPRARGAYALHAIGRLKGQTTIAAAQSELDAVAAALAREFPATNADRGVRLAPLRDEVFGTELRQTSALFLGVVGLVLLICCANVASLLLTRATARRRELAIRSALGADRSRVVRQLLTESLVLAGLGGALGLAIGAAILDLAPALVPEALLPAVVSLALDARVVAFCAAASLGAGLLFGLAPAWQATDFSAAQALASSSRTSTSSRGGLRSLLVAGQVATAVVLLFCAGLLLRTLLAVESVDRGYRAQSVLTMIVDPMGSEYPTDADELRFYDGVGREVSAIPGVMAVAWATTLPMGESYEGTVFFEVVGDTRPADRQRPSADYQVVSPSYFRTVDLPLVAGRGFDERDIAGAPRVCIVNEALARAHAAGTTAIGRQIAMRSGEAPDAAGATCEIVGIARQVKGHPAEESDLLQIYVPLAQDTPGDIFLLVRSASGEAAALTTAVRAAIARLDPAQLVSVRSPMTLDDVAAEATARHQFRAMLVAAFAGLALVLAMVGLFGVLAYTVQRQVRDIGVRRALGATTRDLLVLVGGRAAKVIGLGAVLGLVVSPLVGRMLETMLFGVRPLDMATLVVVTMVVAAAAVLSALGPAWRASRVDAATALRME
jgi:putative ABC transport system permease protein